MAARLGTTAEHLWGVLVRQAYVSSITNIVLLLILLAAGSIMTHSGRMMDTDYYAANKAHRLKHLAIWAFGLFMMALWVILIMANGSDIVAGLVNPEYWALKRVMP